MSVVGPKTALVLAFAIAACFAGADQLEKRTEFPIALARLSVVFNNETHAFQHVRIYYDNTTNYVVISPLSAYMVKFTSEGREKSEYPKASQQGYLLSAFEAEQLNQVCKSFIATLDELQGDLQHQQWDRCLYLDAFLPRFLKGYFYLYCAVRNSMTALPIAACVPDTAYEPSIASPQSDERIGRWRSDPQRIIKLRIICEELIYQLKKWQDKELTNKRRDPDTNYGKKMEEAFTLFVKLYFNQDSDVTVPAKGKHL
ncbi:MAG: hypothetical protein PHC61_18180 [Chitinivibrionales bacterium]|nr:hypothetical protein [Chitinivibrionales bacterium]